MYPPESMHPRPPAMGRAELLRTVVDCRHLAAAVLAVDEARARAVAEAAQDRLLAAARPARPAAPAAGSTVPRPRLAVAAARRRLASLATVALGSN